MGYTLAELGIFAAGKARRFFTGHFAKDYARAQEALREGACARCGACCKLLFRCPYLVEEEGGPSSCLVQGRKSVNCRIFPVNAADLAERDIVSPSVPCGFRFP